MKQIIPLLIVAIALFSCPFVTPKTPPPMDVNALHTAAFGTAIAMVSRNMTMTAGAATATHTPTSFPTLTPSFTPFPFPAEIESLLQGKCEKPWQREGIAFNIRSYGLVERYEGRGCRLPLFSPNGKYLAYTTLDKAENQDVYVDTVRVIQTAAGKVQDIYFAQEMDFVSNLEWTSAGQLIIQESIWEGAFFILVYDPARDSILTTTRLNRDSKLEWNRTGTAFYAEHSQGYGAGVCIHELRGYDFIHNNPFPDFYEIFNVEKEERPLLGIPNGKTDDLAIEPFAWDRDGSRLWVTITVLHQWEDGLYYETGPRQAGVLELTEGKVTFTMLASDPNLDYSFEGSSPAPRIISSPYQPHRCP